MKNKVCFLSAIILIFLSSCKQRCSLFDRSLLAWQPHTLGDTLIFKDTIGNVIKFVISKYYISEGGEFPKCSKCACGVSSYTESQEDSTHNISYLDFTIYYFASEQNQFGLNILNCPFTFWLDYSETTYTVLKYSSQEKSFVMESHQVKKRMTINDKTYYDIMDIEDDSLHPNDFPIWKVLLSKGKGIIQFYDKRTHTSFALQE